MDPASWQLRIHGMVQREVTLTFDELLRRPLIEDYITLTCVSNPVGGPYVGNALWLGASLADLIRQARPLAGADQLLCTSVDGFTSGTPLQVVLDGRDALLAVAMNGQAAAGRARLPGADGGARAVRLRVRDKWVTDIEVTTFAAANAYWVQRGWSQQAPIKTESRIDVPAGNSTIAPGRTPVAGVAWAQHKGIAAVEVRVDRARGSRRSWPRCPTSTRGGSGCGSGTPTRALTCSRPGPPTRPATPRPPWRPAMPNGASGYPSAAVTVSNP